MSVPLRHKGYYKAFTYPKILQGKFVVQQEPSSEEKAFIRAFWLAEFGDSQPRLIYADWLDEHNRPEEAKRARANLPPLYCSCAGNAITSAYGGMRKLICRACGGRGGIDVTSIGDVAQRSLSCKHCIGRGSIYLDVVCPDCNGRWFPPDIYKLEAGDPVWSVTTPDEFRRGTSQYKSRPQFQGDEPYGRFIGFDPMQPSVASIRVTKETK